MSPPPTPSVANAIASTARLSWLRVVRGNKLWVALVAVALVVLSITGARYAQDGRGGADILKEGVNLGFFNLLVFLVPFLFTSGAIAEEVEGRTFHFLTSRPISRFSLLIGKYISGVGMSALLLLGALLLTHLATLATDPTAMFEALPDTARAGGALLMLTMLYGAICMFWGAVAPEAAGTLSVLYLAVMEFGFGSAPFFLRVISLNFLGKELAGLPRGGLLAETVPELPVWAGAAAIPTVTLIFLGLAMVTITTSEYRFGKA